uniref:Mediator of RNA polymerase II transcription subunit 30 n=1 Tax=Maylandia zebra TaxID=106582 RepID=A0A3P9DUZ5_9CICH
MAASLPQKPGWQVCPHSSSSSLSSAPRCCPKCSQQPMPPQGALREISPVSSCRIGQELYKNCHTHYGDLQITRLPNGVTQSQATYQDRLGSSRNTFEKKCNFNRDLPRLCVQLVPYAGEELVSVRVEPCSPAKLRQKNQEMKVLMDQMRNLLWDINAMLTLRK